MLSIDETKEELNAYRNNLIIIEKMEEELKYYREQSENCTSKLSDTPKGKGISDKVSKYASIIADIEREQLDWLIELQNKKKEVDQKIKMLKQPYMSIIYLKYVIGMDLKDIADKLGYTHKWCCSLHGTALINYQNIELNKKN